MPSRPLAATSIAVVLLLTACTTAPMVAPSASPEPSPPAASGDGVLRLGTLLPTTGATSFLSAAQAAGVELAVREINEAGGVLGEPVEVFHRDSADASSSVVEASYAELVAQGVDVIVGPASSVLAERILPLAIADGVALISPSATAPSLSSLDDDGLLLRTVPSAALQGEALATLLEEEGAQTVAALTFDDAMSAAVTSALSTALGDDAVTVDETFTAEADVAALVSLVADAAPDAVVVSSPFAAAATNVALLTSLAQAGFGGDSLWLTSGNLADYSRELPPGTLEGVRGVLDGRSPDEGFAARVRAMDPRVSDLRYAAEAYDAVVLAALAATVAGDDGGASVAYRIPGVSGEGIKCVSFGECLDVLTTRDDIDYDGASGPLALDSSGDPQMAHFRVLLYGADNRPAPSADVLVE
ncbi:ABC transporter substrate-binding protein [Salinibacterium sp. SYSU T00001]|uniref:ABC transporter substrate-binding protein n=1 Tax=Homoserinimonas sedimenticola TaxID=2986805 RepID=UPI002236A4C0|nr:ABC transporter substrate-binding protein [Salinibacterium sedimenticola]MCW4385273.1 ABC transporter substrate-binding protein [Salinibacterium sedimenticola]